MFPTILPIPTKQNIRDTGWKGDVTMFPLTETGYRKRCKYNGCNPDTPPNAAWFYAPNQLVQEALNKGD